MEEVIAEMGSVWPGYELLTPAGWKTVSTVGRTSNEFIYRFEDGTEFQAASGKSLTIRRGRVCCTIR